MRWGWNRQRQNGPEIFPGGRSRRDAGGTKWGYGMAVDVKTGAVDGVSWETGGGTFWGTFLGLKVAVSSCQ